MDWSSTIQEFERKVTQLLVERPMATRPMTEQFVESIMISQRKIPAALGIKGIYAEHNKSQQSAAAQKSQNKSTGTKPKKQNKTLAEDQPHSGNVNKKAKLPVPDVSLFPTAENKYAILASISGSDHGSDRGSTICSEDGYMDALNDENLIEMQPDTEPSAPVVRVEVKEVQQSAQKVLKTVKKPVKEVSTSDNTAKSDSAKSEDPFNVFGVEDVFAFNQSLSESAKFATKMGGKFLKIFPESEADTVAIAEFLLKNKFGYYRKSVGDYPLRAVVKGLPYSCSTELIKEALEEKNFQVISVEQMSSKRDGRALPFYKVQIKRSATAKKIFKVTRLCHVVVKVESLRTTKKAIICYNCNKFHHYARECNMPTVCGKCTGNHPSSACTTVTKEENSQKPKCNNCGLEHVTSYLGCKSYPLKPQFAKKKTFAEVLKEKKKKPQQEKKKKPQQAAKKTVSPPLPVPAQNAEMVQETKKFQADLKSISDLVTEIKAEFGIQNMDELKNMLQEALAKIRKCKSVEEKLFTFVDTISDFQNQSTVPPHSSPVA